MEFNTNIIRPNINENFWVMQIKERLHALEQQEEEGSRVSVFNVPKELWAMKPEAYVPLSVSIGPYHSRRSELYDMESYKLAVAHSFEKGINGRKFVTVVEEFQKHDCQIRSCYSKYIDYKEETFAWLMALDAAFLLEFLQFYVRYVDESSHTEFKLLGRVLGLSGTSAAENAIVRDMMMLENQLPLFLLQKLLELQFEGSKSKAEEKLRRLLRLVCQQLSPFTFKLPEDSKLCIDERGHVLEVLYYSIIPLSRNQIPSPTEQEGDEGDISDSDQIPSPPEQEGDAADISDMSTIKRAIGLLCKTLSSLNVGPIQFLTSLARRTLNRRPLRFAIKLARLCTVLINQEEGEVEESSVKIILPAAGELDIPSVADLCFAGVKFCVTDGDLTAIKFDERTATLYLPKVKLDTNTEVIMRNLVAFEASAAPGALVFRRYIDFMNGMIDSEEDVRLLRERGIISNYLQNDQAVASLWNSMGKCAYLRKVADLDKVVENLNRYYKSRGKVIVVEFAKKRIFKSLKILYVLAAAILLFVACLQAFCSVYECKKWLET